MIAVKRTMKTVTISNRSQYKTLHIEAPGCIVNIMVGLSDHDGREVTNISVTTSQYAGEQPWFIDGGGVLKAQHFGLRVIRDEKVSA